MLARARVSCPEVKLSRGVLPSILHCAPPWLPASSGTTQNPRISGWPSGLRGGSHLVDAAVGTWAVAGTGPGDTTAATIAKASIGLETRFLTLHLRHPASRTPIQRDDAIRVCRLDHHHHISRGLENFDIRQYLTRASGARRVTTARIRPLSATDYRQRGGNTKGKSPSGSRNDAPRQHPSPTLTCRTRRVLCSCSRSVRGSRVQMQVPVCVEPEHEPRSAPRRSSGRPERSRRPRSENLRGYLRVVYVLLNPLRPFVIVNLPSRPTEAWMKCPWS